MTTRPKNTSPIQLLNRFGHYFLSFSFEFSMPYDFGKSLSSTVSTINSSLFFFLLDFSSFFSCRHIQAEQQHLIDTLVIIDVWTKQHTHKRQRLLWHFVETPPHNHQCENGCLIYFSFHASRSTHHQSNGTILINFVHYYIHFASRYVS